MKDFISTYFVAPFVSLSCSFLQLRLHIFTTEPHCCILWKMFGIVFLKLSIFSWKRQSLNACCSKTCIISSALTVPERSFDNSWTANLFILVLLLCAFVCGSVLKFTFEMHTAFVRNWKLSHFTVNLLSTSNSIDLFPVRVWFDEAWSKVNKITKNL